MVLLRREFTKGSVAFELAAIGSFLFLFVVYFLRGCLFSLTCMPVVDLLYLSGFCIADP